MKPGMILSSFDGAYSLSEPTLDEGKLPQPKIFEGKLKSYQLKVYFLIYMTFICKLCYS